MSMDEGPVRFTIPNAPPVGEELTDKLLALYPLGTVPYAASEGGREREATECYVVQVLTVEDSKTYIDLGRMPVPWDQPRRELAKATTDAPWVLGTIVKRNVAYFLNPPRPAELRQAQGALTDFLADRRADREERQRQLAADAAAKAEQEAAQRPARARGTRSR